MNCLTVRSLFSPIAVSTTTWLPFLFLFLVFALFVEPWGHFYRKERFLDTRLSIGTVSLLFSFLFVLGYWFVQINHYYTTTVKVGDLLLFSGLLFFLACKNKVQTTKFLFSVITEIEIN